MSKKPVCKPEEQFRYAASLAGVLVEDWYDICPNPDVRAHWFNLRHSEVFVEPDVGDVSSLVGIAAKRSPWECAALLVMTASRAELAEFEAGTRKLLCWSNEHRQGATHVSLRGWLTERGKMPRLTPAAHGYGWMTWLGGFARLPSFMSRRPRQVRVKAMA